MPLVDSELELTHPGIAREGFVSSQNRIGKIKELHRAGKKPMTNEERLALFKQLAIDLEKFNDSLRDLDTQRRLTNFQPDGYLRTVVFDFGRNGHTGREFYTTVETETLTIMTLSEKRQNAFKAKLDAQGVRKPEELFAYFQKIVGK